MIPTENSARVILIKTQMRRIIPLLIFLITALLVTFAPIPVHARPVERLIRVTAENYAFSPAVIYANPGDQITVELVSKDVAHGLSVDGYPVDLHAEPGRSARTTFIAERAGTFKIRCTVACGNLHPFMTGKIAVGPNLLLYRALGLALLVMVYGAVQAVWKIRVAR